MKKINYFILALLLAAGAVSLYSYDQYEDCYEQAYDWVESGTPYEDAYEMFLTCMEP